MQQVKVWKDTVDACPKLGSKSRIVVTTSVLSVATACSSGSYVYRMGYLSDDDSKSLFWRKVYGCQNKEPPYSLVTDSECIFSKCGGLPLALTSVAKHLNIIGEKLESTHCREVGQNLGKDYLSAGNNNAAVSVFKEMRRALRHCYDSLPDYDHRSCMLYLGIFPKGHQIKSKSLVRRLKAEGLVNEGCKCFDELIDRCIVEPVQICNNSVVAKRCQVHSVVLEYIIQKSVAKNVVTLIQDLEPVLKGSTEACVRRLSIQSSTKERFDELDDDKSALRSLTMFNTEPCDLQKCKMLRILDLEGCNGLDQEFLEGLCELLFLKYLNLRKTRINKLPPKIEKLQRLETLDIRETKVERLPMQVIMLPKLAYLFGKFQLPEVPTKGKEADKLYAFLKKNSVLHTLAGFVTNKRRSPEHVILLARNLKKVKVWCNTPADLFPDPELVSSSSVAASDRPSTRKSNRFPLWSGSKTRGLVSQDHKTEERRSDTTDFIKLLKKRVTPLESVSIISSELCNDFLGSLEGPCTISSIKLRGILNSLPDSNKLAELGRIKKLQLFSTGLTIKDLSALQCLRGLEYLKMVEHNTDRFCNGVFIVEKKGFESLKSLCIDAPKLPKMQFKEGSMRSLTSLYLLCPNSQLPSGTIEGISHLANLSEVMLHSSMEKAWETVANGHPNRPCVKRQPAEPIGITAA